jgi:hypothetical protein
MKVNAERFCVFRTQLRKELYERGYVASQYFETLNDKVINVGFVDSDGKIVVYWGPKESRHKLIEPNPRYLAENMIATLGMDSIQPPPPLGKPKQPTAAPRPAPTPRPEPEVQKGVLISQAELDELYELRQKAASGRWMSDETYRALKEEMRIGYIPKDKRQEILDKMDALIRRMTC